MKEVARVSAFSLRSYRDADETGVLELLSATLGGGPTGERSSDVFRWKHLENPFGRSYMMVAEAEGRIIALRSFMRWRFLAGNLALRGVRAVDTTTHPDYQRRGIFTKLTGEALENLAGEADFVFNTPNVNSLPGDLRMGWRKVGKIPISVRVRRPVKVLTRFRSAKSGILGPRPRPSIEAETAADALLDPGLPSLLADVAERRDNRIATPRDLKYLWWRYAAAHLLDYRAVREESEGGLAGIALFRVRPRGELWESTVAEVIVRVGDRTTARRLLRGVVKASSVDHLTCHFPSGSASSFGARRAGFVRIPGGMTFLVNPLNGGLQPEPTELRSWALTLGDLEVF
ncbi:MAG: GNAT family N-acetyltransferase [Actinomycetota bacterium]